MKKIIFAGLATLALLLTARAQETHFSAGHLAVLRAGDGTFDLTLRQAPVFVDQYDLDGPNAAPSFTVSIPTNGPHSFFFNGHAGTEGLLTRSADHRVLAFAGYGGVDLLKVSGTAARLDIQRGFTTVDRDGRLQTVLYPSDTGTAKVNARGVATDGTNNFWGCGNSLGTFYFNPDQLKEPARFDNFLNCRSFRIINGVLYGSINSADAFAGDQPPGIYNFLPADLPRATNTFPNLFLAAGDSYQKITTFDLNLAGDTAYVADTKAGIQKYVKAGGAWKFAYNFAIPQNIPPAENTGTGCFGLVVDFSKPSPVIYATTTEGYGGSVNSNRVVRVVDAGATSPVATLIQAPSANVAFRGIDFTPY